MCILHNIDKLRTTTVCLYLLLLQPASCYTSDVNNCKLRAILHAQCDIYFKREAKLVWLHRMHAMFL